MTTTAKILVHVTANNEFNICWEMLDEATGNVIGKIRKSKRIGTYLGQEVGYEPFEGRNHVEIARKVAAAYRARNA